MSGYADTGFLASLFLLKGTTAVAEKCMAGLNAPLPLIPLAILELRNTFNLAVARKRITFVDRDALWRQFEAQIRGGLFVETSLSAADLHARARELSDRHTPKLATRSLDLLHVAAAKLLNAREFYSFDERQRKTAAIEGLKVRP